MLETGTAPVGTTVVEPAVTASWRDALPEEHRGAETLKKFDGKDWSEVGPKLAVSYINLEKMPRGVAVPPDGAPQADWDAFYTKLGRPATAEEYGIDVKVPEGLSWNKAAESKVLAKLHARGLTKSQAQGVIDDYLGLANEGRILSEQGKNQTIETASAAMRTEWGGLYDQNIALVQRIVNEFGDDDFKNYLDDTGMGNDPRFLKWAYAVGRPMLEDNLIRGDGLGMKRAEAQAEIDTIMASDAYKKGDKAAIARIFTLYPIANSD